MTRLEFGGGSVPTEGTLSDTFNVIEAHQANLRPTAGSITTRPRPRPPIATAAARTTPPRCSFAKRQPVIVNNVFLNNAGSVASIDANAMTSNVVRDLGRSTGFVDVVSDPNSGDLLYADNAGPLIRQNRFEGNTLNALRVRGEVLTTESIWDDVDIVHVLFDEISLPNFHTLAGCG